MSDVLIFFYAAKTSEFELLNRLVLLIFFISLLWMYWFIVIIKLYNPIDLNCVSLYKASLYNSVQWNKWNWFSSRTVFKLTPKWWLISSWRSASVYFPSTLKLNGSVVQYQFLVNPVFGDLTNAIFVLRFRLLKLS